MLPLRLRVLTVAVVLVSSALIASPGASAAPLRAHHAPTPPFPAILGGTAVAPGEHPYIAHVVATYTLGADVRTQACTGSLIAPNVVLTAAHCVFYQEVREFGPSYWSVVLGVSDLSTDTAPATRSVVTVDVYPYYNPLTLQGDAALLILDQPAPAGTAVIPLASSATPTLYAAGLPVSIEGWGRTSNGADPAPLVLQTGTVAVQTNATCLGADPKFHPGFDVCTDALGFSPAFCYGDSGGPVVANTAGGPVEIGINSYVRGGCGLAPDFETRASSVQPWIASVLTNVAAPPAFVPPFVPPAPAAQLAADGLAVSIPTPAVDPATLLTGYTASLVNAAGQVVSTQSLPSTAVSAAFPGLKPGTYSVSVVANYTEGVSAPGVSPAVTLAPPANVQPPTTTGSPVVGSTLTCHPGTWDWPGTATYAMSWLRSGRTIEKNSPTYRVSARDVGGWVACRVVLTASTGPTAARVSAPTKAARWLHSTSRPRVRGAARVGSRLSCRTGTWSRVGSLKIVYQWLRDGKPVTKRSQRSDEYTATTADVGKRLACRVTAIAASQTKSKTTRPLHVSLT